jgi:hypothetical protein
MRSTHTFVVLDISPEAYNEIAAKLHAADYGHCFIEQDGRTVIDMAGIAVAEGEGCSTGCHKWERAPENALDKCSRCGVQVLA